MPMVAVTCENLSKII